MNLKYITLSLLFLLVSTFTFGQVVVTNVSPTVTVNFSNSMQTTVGSSPSTASTGAGFSPNPTVAGRLNSNAWEVKGWSFGDCLFGGTQTVDDFARGAVTVGVITPGMYVYTEFPGTAANPALMIQPGVGDFDPGTIALKIKNNGTSNLTQLSIDYNLFVRNDENTSSSFKFSHSADNVVYVNEPLLDYISPDVADALQWNIISTAPTRTVVINGLNIAPGGFYYIRWSSNLVTGTGDSDEFGLDDIVVSATYGAPAPEINVTSYGNTLLSGDTSPTVAKGTDFAPSYNPMSTLNSTLQISYTIQNLGGLPLNITSVTITGANPGDFTIGGSSPVGSIPAASATISTKSLTIVFDPSAAGLRKARINIFNNDSDENPYWFDVQGYGVVPIPIIRINGDGPQFSIVSPGSMVPNVNNNTLFGTQTVGGAGQTNTFAIRNDCPYNAPLLLTDPTPYITIGGNNPADFTLVTIPTGNSINPGFKRQFAIKFVPTGNGIRNAIVSIASNDPNTNPHTFLVQGTGIAPEMDVTANGQPVISGSLIPSFVNYTFFDYLDVTTGSLIRTFTITNSGTVTLNVGAINIAGVNAADFAVVTAPPATLAAAATGTFTIKFDPSALGLRVATISIVNNDPNENPYIFAVSGYGVNYVPCTYNILEVIAKQDFEAAPAAPVWTFATSGTTSLVAGTAFGALGDSGTSLKYLGARSLQVINGTGVVTMTNIDTRAYTDVELNLRLASLSVNATDGADATDRVMVMISADGGATWSNELEVTGNTDAKWSFVSGIGIAATPYDGNNVQTVFNSTLGAFLSVGGYSTIALTNLPKVSSLAVRISLANNNANEVWAIDNVTLFGRKELSSTWTGTWSAGVPTTSTKAIISANYNTAVNGNISSCKCTVNTGATLTINTNTFIDVQSEIDNNGSLIIENGGSLIQRNDLAVNTGVIKVKRFTTAMRQYDYTYWSSPVSGQTLFGLSPNTLWDKYFKFNPTAGSWQVIPNGTDIMLAGKGYIIRAPQTFNNTPQVYNTGEFNGIPNNGVIQTPIVLGVSNMNLIGNPYASALSANAFLSNLANTGVVEGTIYLWTHNTPITAQVYTANDYAVYNFSGSVATAPALSSGVSNGAPTGFIASGQGFFIKGLANGQATFNNSMRVSGSNTNFFRPGTTQSGIRELDEDAISGLDKNRIWLNLSNAEGAFKQTMVGYIQNATNDYDRGFDGELFNANAFVSLYSILDNTKLAIQGKALPFETSDRVPLGYNATVAGIFEISIDHSDGVLESQNIYLEDKFMQVVHDLRQSSYSFETAIGTFDNRFVLRYEAAALGNTAFASAANALLVTVKDRAISIYSQEVALKSIAVYDLLGRELYNNLTVRGEKYTIQNLNSSQQALVVKITLENGAVVTRKILF